MTTAIYRPSYTTREEVMRSLDVKHAAYNAQQVDRQLMMAADSVDGLCKRQFFPKDDTRFFDWPNFQYTYPWRLWLDANELATNQTGNPSMSLVSGGKTIPNTAFFCRPENYGPPYTFIELDRSQNYSFGNGPTPQREIVLTGTFGYSTKTFVANTLAAAVNSTTSTTLTMSPGVDPGIGDTLLIDSERMIVQEKNAITTGVTVSGLSASAIDDLLPVPDTTQFAIGETLLYDDERLLVQDAISGSLVVKRGWDGTILTAHTSGTLYALRQLTVLRGVLGTSAATHLNGANISTFVVPGLVKELALAEAIVGLTQEPGAYTFGLLSTLSTSANVYGSSAHGQQREPGPGLGLADLRVRVLDRYGRKARQRVV